MLWVLEIGIFIPQWNIFFATPIYPNIPHRTYLKVSRWLVNGLFHLLINGVYWGCNPFTNHLLTSWDIQVPQTLNQQFMKELFPFGGLGIPGVCSYVGVLLDIDIQANTEHEDRCLQWLKK